MHDDERHVEDSLCFVNESDVNGIIVVLRVFDFKILTLESSALLIVSSSIILLLVAV